MRRRVNTPAATSRRRMLVAAVAAAAVLGGMLPAAQAASDLDALHKAALAANERQVVIFGPPDATTRVELTKRWSARFPEIELVYSGMSGRQIATKMKAEEKAGIHTVDVIVNGASTGSLLLKPNNLIQPLEKFLVLADVKNPANWFGGKLAWVDDDRTMLAMLSMITPAAIVNRTMVKPDEITSDLDLMNPKWKGKIISNDPLQPGSANVVFRRLYDLHGPEFLARFIKEQEVVFSSDLRQPLDWVAKGRYAIALGPSPTLVIEYTSKGVDTLGVDHILNWKENLANSAGYGGLAVAVRPAHPAAATLFVNWLLTREGQVALSTGVGNQSRRVDADVPSIPSFIKAQNGRDYIDVFVESHTTSPNVKAMRDTIRDARAK